MLEAVDWDQRYRPACPRCAQPVSGLREQYRRRAGVRHPVVVALAWACGCAVDGHAAALRADAPAQTELPRAELLEAGMPAR